MNDEDVVEFVVEFRVEFRIYSYKNEAMYDRPPGLKIELDTPYAKDKENNKIDYSHGNNIKDFAVDVDCAKTDNHGIYRK